MSTSIEQSQRIVIPGAASRDFHNFNIVYRDDPTVRMVAFTAITQAFTRIFSRCLVLYDIVDACQRP
jgi:predicted GTPase